MKHYIRGVGSGFPIVREYLEVTHGSISIDDNIDHGAVVTISLTPQQPVPPEPAKTMPMPYLSEREQQVLPLFESEGALGVTDIHNLTGLPQSSIHNILSNLEENGLIERTAVKSKRILTDFGLHVSQHLGQH